jgi:hypothetical protein
MEIKKTIQVRTHICNCPSQNGNQAYKYLIYNEANAACIRTGLASIESY